MCYFNACFINCALKGFDIDTWLNIGMLAVTVISVICAFLVYAHQRKRAKKETACRLAEFYAKNIVERNAYISSVFRHAKLDESIKIWFPLSDIVRFNAKEMEKLLEGKNVDIATVKQQIAELDIKAILKGNVEKCHTAEARKVALDEYVEYVKNSNGELKSTSEYFLRSDFLGDIVAFLNDLEWFAMNFRYGIADEQLVYQSLHQSFLSIVWLLYYYISKSNSGAPEDKYYTNIIWLFNVWKARMYKMKKKNEQKRKRAEKKLRQAAKAAEREYTYEGRKV